MANFDFLEGAILTDEDVLIVKCYLYVWDHVIKSYWNIMGNGQKIFVP